MTERQAPGSQPEPSSPPEAIPLSKLERWLYGGAGGVLPVIVELAGNAGKLRSLDELSTLPVGIAVKAILFFYVGGLIAHAVLAFREKEIWKAIITGIGAPALVVQGLNYTPPQFTPAKLQTSQLPFSFELISSARADVPSANERLYSLCIPRYGRMLYFLKGLFGHYGSEEYLWILASNTEGKSYIFSDYSKAEEAYNAAASNPIAQAFGEDVGLTRPGQDLSIFVTPANEFLVALRLELTDGQYKALLRRPDVSRADTEKNRVVRFGDLRDQQKLDWCEGDRFPRTTLPNRKS